MRRSWGLRTRVLVAAAVTAAVALATFGILLKALDDQRDAAARARGTTEAIAAAGQLQRLPPVLESAVRAYALTGEERFLAPADRARPRVPPPGPHRPAPGRGPPAPPLAHRP